MRGYGSSRKNGSKIFDKGCLEDFRFSLDFKDLNKKESIMAIEAFLSVGSRRSYTTAYHYLNLWKPLLPAAKQTTLKVDSQKAEVRHYRHFSKWLFSAFKRSSSHSFFDPVPHVVEASWRISYSEVVHQSSKNGIDLFFY